MSISLLTAMSISLLTDMSKILEITIFKRLEQHLDSNNILATEQFGFRKGVHIERCTYWKCNLYPYWQYTHFTKSTTAGRGVFFVT
jgi:hypothetical protein